MLFGGRSGIEISFSFFTVNRIAEHFVPVNTATCIAHFVVNIPCTFNALCKVVIRYAAIDTILKLRRRWEREVSLDYLMNAKTVYSVVKVLCRITQNSPTHQKNCAELRKS